MHAAGRTHLPASDAGGGMERQADRYAGKMLSAPFHTSSYWGHGGECVNLEMGRLGDTVETVETLSGDWAILQNLAIR